MSVEKEKIFFTGIQKQCKKAYEIYTDFESILSPISTATQHPQISHTIQTAQHILCSYAFLVIGPKEKSYNSIKFFKVRML